MTGRKGGTEMITPDLGPWGIGADETAVGRAVAALGVALGAAGPRASLSAALRRASDASELRPLLDRATVPWRWTPVATAAPTAWARLAARWPAETVAAAWEQAIGDRTPETAARLAVERFSDAIASYEWLADRLLQPGVGVVPNVLAPELANGHAWHWPVRVGLLGGPVTSSVRETLSRESSTSDLHELVASPDEPADVLLLTDTLTDALPRLVALARPLDVGCAIALGGRGNASDLGLTALLGSLRLRARPWGLAIAHLSPTDVGAWFESFVVNLAHDLTLDRALGASLGNASPWLLFAEPSALEATRVTQAATQMVVAMRREAAAIPLPEPLAAPGAGAEPPPDLAPEGVAFDLPVEPEIRDVTARAVDPANYLHEAAGARATATLSTALRATRARRRRTGVPRWIQADIRRGARFRGPNLRGPLAPATLHGIDVWIGPKPAPSADQPIMADVVFPDELLPPEQVTHRLRIVFAELGGSHRTTSGEVELPPAGPGTRHRFWFRTPSEGSFRARIIVAYENRILQTALLTAPAAATSARAGGRAEAVIRLEVEAVVRPGLAELEGRRRFGAAIVHNHDEAGAPIGTVLHDGHAIPLELGGIEPTTSQITAFLSDAAGDPDSYGPTIDAAATVALLFRLALQGVLLHDDLFSRPGFKEHLGSAERIQVLAADRNAVLPLEFVYELPAPARPPKLCSNAKKALLAGRCEDRFHRVDALGHLDVVCPSGFWAISRVIERHVADPEAVKAATGGSSYSLDSEPVSGRKTLAGLRAAVFGASARVDEVVRTSSANVEAALATATGGRSVRARTWADWVGAVRAEAPSLLVILAHSAQDPTSGQTALEIEADQRCSAGELTSRFLFPDDSRESPPIVFLLGCDTAIADLQYQTFVSRFRELQAAIVLGTIATVAGSHAAGVAVALANALKVAATSGSPAFGDLLRDVRRRLLANGEVMALALTSYGDADWQFTSGGEP